MTRRPRRRRASTRAVPNATGTTSSTPRQPAQRLGVVDGERWVVPPSTPGMPRVFGLARVDREEVGAELGELAEDVVARALADRGEQDHRGDADGDAEHREHRAQPVARRGRRARGGGARASTSPPRQRRDRVEPARAPRRQHAEEHARPPSASTRPPPPPRPAARRAAPGRRAPEHLDAPPSRGRGRPAPPAVESSAASARNTASTCPPPAPSALQQADLGACARRPTPA